MVEHALALIADGSLEKVVLARAVTVDADHPWDVRTVLATLHAAQPGCVVYGDGGFVGASPELLVRKHGAQVSARPLAGTGIRSRRAVALDQRRARARTRRRRGRGCDCGSGVRRSRCAGPKRARSRT